MQLKFPLALVALLPIIGLLVWRLRKPAKRAKRFVAGAATALPLPSYAKVKRRARLLGIAHTVLLALLLVVLVVIVARPQQTIRKVDSKNSRDIVLCLDSSGSMEKYLPGALNAMTAIVTANPTDRYALVIFQNTSYAALPLTSDVAAITLKLSDLTTQITSNGVSAAQLAGFNIDLAGGTDIGAGLAGCIRRFDKLEEPRSRHIIMLSDMENNGITNQATVAELIPKYGITLHVLAPGDGLVDVPNSPVVQITGATVANLDGSQGVQQVVAEVFTTILNQQQSVQFVSVDAPYPWWLAALVLASAWAGVHLMRWRFGI